MPRLVTREPSKTTPNKTRYIIFIICWRGAYLHIYLFIYLSTCLFISAWFNDIFSW
jgi:hypothetical protein